MRKNLEEAFKTNRTKNTVWEAVLPYQVHELLVTRWRGLHHFLLQLPNLQRKSVNQLRENGMSGFK